MEMIECILMIVLWISSDIRKSIIAKCFVIF